MAPPIDYSKLDRIVKDLYDSESNGYPFLDLQGVFGNRFPGTDMPTIERHVARIKVLGLATNDGAPGLNYRITPLGRQVHEAGGWLAYEAQVQASQAAEAAEKAQEKANRQEEISIAKQALKASKGATNASWVSGTFAILAFVFSIYQFYDAKSTNKAMESSTDSLRSELKALQTRLTMLQKSQLQTKYPQGYKPTGEKKK